MAVSQVDALLRSPTSRRKFRFWLRRRRLARRWTSWPSSCGRARAVGCTGSLCLPVNTCSGARPGGEYSADPRSYLRSKSSVRSALGSPRSRALVAAGRPEATGSVTRMDGCCVGRDGGVRGVGHAKATAGRSDRLTFCVRLTFPQQIFCPAPHTRDVAPLGARDPEGSTSLQHPSSRCAGILPRSAWRNRA